MAVYTTRGGGGLLGTLSRVATIGSMFVPGLQPIAAGLSAINAAAQGDPIGAVTNAAGLVNPAPNAAKAPAPAAPPNASVANAISRIARGESGLTSITPGVSRWNDVRQGDPRWRELMGGAVYGAGRRY
jgi:nucleoid-associated protein YgaU